MTSSLQQGINAAKAGHLKKALDFLKDAIIDEPQNADVWVWIAAIIDDVDKQEIFLKKALDIDPDNIPAQRGLAYLNKRKRDEASVRGQHLSDHTTPITPFPSAERPKETSTTGWSQEAVDEISEIAVPAADDETDKHPTAPKPEPGPKLTPMEISLLVVVTVVFCFIGVIAASAIFDFEIPLGFLNPNRPRLATEPPYPGVFLYENQIYFNIQQHEGQPTMDIGIPTSYQNNPLLVLWQTDFNPEQLNLIYETGEIFTFQTSQGRYQTDLLRSNHDLNPGLYCLQLPADPDSANEGNYWCFKVDLSTALE